MTQCPLILISDDDPVVHESLSIYLDAEGYEHISAYDGEQALKMIEERQPDLMILDLMMPKMSGIDVCRTVRLTKTLPIIMLTAKSEEIDRILGLELGADDYIVKPFSPREVLARIKAVLRRFSEPAQQDESIIRFPQLEINLSNYQVKSGDKVFPARPRRWKSFTCWRRAPVRYSAGNRFSLMSGATISSAIPAPSIPTSSASAKSCRRRACRGR